MILTILRYRATRAIWDKKSSHGPKSVAVPWPSPRRPFSVRPLGSPKTVPDGFQDGPRGPKLRIMLAHSPQDGCILPKMVPKKPSRWPTTPPRRPMGSPRRLRTSPGRPKSLKILWFFNDFYYFAFSRHRSSKNALDGPKTAQNGFGTVPRRP